MAKAKGAPRQVADPSQLAAEARRRLEAEGSLKLTALGPAAVRGEVAAELVRLGFELTKSVIRRPVSEQLSRALADGAFIPLKRVATHISGASAPEAQRAALALVSAGSAFVVLRGKEEVLVPGSASVLSRKELAAAAAIAKLVIKVASSRTGLSLLHADLTDALEQALPRRTPAAAARFEKKPLDPALTRLLSAVDSTRDENTGLSFVPSIVARLAPALSSEAAQNALLSAANSGLLELRPEGGINRLTAEELVLCPPGPQGTRLSWARRTESSAQ